MPLLNLGGNQILASTAGSTNATGDWYSVNNLQRLTAQAILTASSAGATAATTVYIEASNTTQIAIATKIATFALTCTTNTVSDGAAMPTSLLGAWKYVRAVLNSLTTSTAGSAGSPAVTVWVGAGSGR